MVRRRNLHREGADAPMGDDAPARSRGHLAAIGLADVN